MNHDTFRTAVIFGFILIIVAMKNFRRIQQQKMWHETARLALEKGQPMPPYMGPWGPWGGRWGRRFGPGWDLRRGLVWLAVGLAIYFAVPNRAHTWGLVPTFVGVAFLVCALIGLMRSDRPPDGKDPMSPM